MIFFWLGRTPGEPPATLDHDVTEEEHLCLRDDLAAELSPEPQAAGDVARPPEEHLVAAHTNRVEGSQYIRTFSKLSHKSLQHNKLKLGIKELSHKS